MRTLSSPLVVLILLLCLSAFGTKVVVPDLTGPVVDGAKLLSADDKTKLTDLLMRLQQTKKIQMAVLTVTSLQGFDIEGFSQAVFEKWKLGTKGQDQGLLMTIAPNERRMRFEVGYGLEGDLTDVFTKQVLDGIVAPYFRKQRYGDGIYAGVNAVAGKLGLSVEKTNPNWEPIEENYDRFTVPLFAFLFLGFLLLMLVVRMRGGGSGYRRRNHDDWWWGSGGGGGWGSGGGSSWGGGGSSDSGGGFSGGGGSFGGGGSSSSW